MIVPALLILVGMALAANYVYVIFSRRSAARLALRDLQLPIRRRQTHLMRLASELDRPDSRFNGVLSRFVELGARVQNRVQDLADEHLVQAENDLMLEVGALERTIGQESGLLEDPLWQEFYQAWSSSEKEMALPIESYNRAVRRFNDSLAGFPGRIIAQLCALRSMPLLMR